VSCLHGQIFLFGHKVDLAIARSGIRSVGSVTQAVLIAQLLLNLVVDSLDRLLFGDFKETGAGLFRNPLENFLAIRTRLLGVSPAPTAMPAHSPHAAATEPSSSPVALLIGEEDGMLQRVGA